MPVVYFAAKGAAIILFVGYSLIMGVPEEKMLATDPECKDQHFHIMWHEGSEYCHSH